MVVKDETKEDLDNLLCSLLERSGSLHRIRRQYKHLMLLDGCQGKTNEDEDILLCWREVTNQRVEDSKSIEINC